ncbi:MAG: hypothetical protein KatS3mg081_1225 [Gemmatimonadales bacterium]|nr:tRNA(fMet)-specific endonuclease VapC [bacterium HR33]GIW51870.1 MAG: hypothetical protein KatS3mg081_1225 [Gemmatimonadales bacterium]
MNAVADTNVIAYYLLGTEPFVRETRRFWQTVREVQAPAIWAAELANVVWMAVRNGVLSSEEGHRRLHFAARLHVRSVSIRTLWHRALARSIDKNLPVCDTLFVELAARERLPLATFDTRLIEAFPDVARRPRAIFR